MRMRVRALFQRLGDAPDFYLVPDALDLRDPQGTNGDQIKAMVRDKSPVLIILDTIASAGLPPQKWSSLS